ncbi:MAG: acyltransferase, partial [Proteobacteria bacterium]|nr:acyltransferase [Pseudomonadota bacterium]
MKSSQTWTDRPEGGGLFALWLILTIARRAGRRITRLLLFPITAYFLFMRGPERRASQDYLGRALGRGTNWWDGARHVHTFASTILDRVFLLGGPIDRFDVRIDGVDEVHRELDQGRGLLLFGSHHGSFDVLRALATRRPDYTIKIVLDKKQAPAMTKLLGALNPQLAANIIDASQDGPSIVMDIQRALSEGALVSLLVDRVRPGEPWLPAQFLGGTARFPTSPWLIASALKVPVAIAFGLYRGGNHYDLAFELFSEQVDIPRQARAEALSTLIQRYATRLEHYVHQAPYNWFNFYDFWHDDEGHTFDDAAVQRRTAAAR